MSAETLKPCPFCGSGAAPRHARLHHSIICAKNHGGCGAESGYYQSLDEAIAAWNRRSQPQEEEPVAWMAGEIDVFLDRDEARKWYADARLTPLYRHRNPIGEG